RPTLAPKRGCERGAPAFLRASVSPCLRGEALFPPASPRLVRLMVHFSLKHQSAARVAVEAKGACQRLVGRGSISQVSARINSGGAASRWSLFLGGKKWARACLGFSRNSSTIATRCTQGMVQ